MKTGKEEMTRETLTFAMSLPCTNISPKIRDR
jgi:hypothetical protein